MVRHAGMPGGRIQAEARWSGDRWLDLGGGHREPREADVALDLTFCPNRPAHPVVGTAERLPFHDGTFALITAIEMLYLVTDLESALAEIRRVLKPGGRLVATCPFSKPSNEPGDWRRPTAHAWAWMLMHAGFERYSVEALGGPWSLSWQAAYLLAQGRDNGDAANVGGELCRMRGGSLAVPAREADQLRLRPVPEPDKPGKAQAQGSGPGAIRGHAREENASSRFWRSLIARTAPAGRWLDRRSGAAWPLGYGVVAVA